MHIERLTTYTSKASACATLLHEAFPHAVSADMAERCVKNLLEEENLLLVAIEGETVAGFVGALVGDYSHAAELHPLVVTEDYRRQGVGRRLVEELEERLAKRGIITVYLGTDDEHFQTSLSEGDLFDHTFAKIASIKNKADHPYTFYERLGYSIVGVIPDANGKNKPDIIMAKRIRKA